MKQSEIQQLSNEELVAKLASLKKEYADMKVSHGVSQLENPMVIRAARKIVARLATELSKREIQ
jgi:large subunit ribosomal protein L29